jgi:hypothetical protein
VYANKDEISVQPELRGKLVALQTCNFWQAIEIVRIWGDMAKVTLHIEDARLATFGRQNDAHRAQGAGSVKRDASLWEGFAEHYGLAYKLVRPAKRAKMDAQTFARLTGWQGRTSQHSRDAGMLVFGL